MELIGDQVELHRVFFARRALWFYALALLPALIFFGDSVSMKFKSERLARRSLTEPALMDSALEGEAVGDVKKRLGKPADERWSVRTKRVQQSIGNQGTTTHAIEPAVAAKGLHHGRDIDRYRICGREDRVSRAHLLRWAA